VVYHENGGNLAIPLLYYSAFPDMFEELDPAYPVADPMTKQPFWDMKNNDQKHVKVQTFKEYVAAQKLPTKYPFCFELSTLKIPISDYPANKKELDDSTFDGYAPYWNNKYQVSFVNLPTLIDYVEALRAKTRSDSIYAPPGVVATYVAYKPADLSLLFNPLNTPAEYQGQNWVPSDAAYTKISFTEYIDLLEVS
jgi:hypothetical protein